MGDRAKDAKGTEAQQKERARRAEAKTVQIKKAATSGTRVRSEMPTLSWKRPPGRA